MVTSPLVGFLAQCEAMIAVKLDIVTVYYWNNYSFPQFHRFARIDIFRGVRSVLKN